MHFAPKPKSAQTFGGPFLATSLPAVWPVGRGRLVGGHSVGGVVWVWVGEASQAVKVGA